MIGSINIHSSGTSSSSSGCIILGTNSNTTISTNLVYSAGTGAFSISALKSTYHILGEDYEVKSTYTDPNLSIVIATLNVLKRPFWEELKKQNIKFDDDLENFIEKRLKIYDRDEKLESLLPD
jgi:hypothetical protein